jgi:flagellin-like hook-associated protein FlgL
MIVGKSLFGASAGFTAITRMQQRMDTLQVQLGTGKKAQTLADLGSERMFDLTIRQRLSRIEGYQNNAASATLRIDVMGKAMERLDKLESETRSSASIGGFGADGINLATVPTLSQARLDEVLTLLNTDVAGRYVFGGNTTDRKPVATINEVLDGVGGRDGFRTVVNERRLADAGTDGLGRLALTRVGDLVTLAEDGTHPFGFKLSTLSQNGSGSFTLTAPAGAPPQLSIQAGTAVVNDTVTIGLTLPDGGQTSITLKAVAGTPDAGEFAIGATATDTATNLQAALNASLLAAGGTSLSVASTFAAADNFFNGSGETIQRVDGPPFETATGYVAATAADTVFWYKGQESADPRNTVAVKVDDATTVGYGAQANEHGFVDLVRSLAVMTVETYPQTDPTAKARFNAVAQAQTTRLAETATPGSIEVVTLELQLAKGTIGSATQRHDAYKVQLDTTLAGIEEVGVEEVAMEMLALRTRLEASYETLSVLSQLSLVNYLR